VSLPSPFQGEGRVNVIYECHQRRSLPAASRVFLMSDAKTQYPCPFLLQKINEGVYCPKYRECSIRAILNANCLFRNNSNRCSCLSCHPPSLFTTHIPSKSVSFLFVFQERTRSVFKFSLCATQYRHRIVGAMHGQTNVRLAKQAGPPTVSPPIFGSDIPNEKPQGIYLLEAFGCSIK